ncbi:MAG: TPM domain-containing protein [Patescibacteria group bacterium]
MMKKISLITLVALLPLVTFAYVSPGKPTGLVNDFARVLTAEESQTIGAKLTALDQQTGVEVAVVTVSTVGTDETIESYAEKLFQEWGIGDAEKDTGLLLLIAVDDRQMRIETGYGIEGAVTDIQSGNIIRNVLTPAFREGKYGEGISAATDALTAIITNSPEAAQYSDTSSSQDSSGWDFDFASIFFVVIIVINMLSRFLGATKSWWLGGVLGAGIGAIIGLIAGFLYVGAISMIVLTILGLIFDFIVSKNPPGSNGKSGGMWPLLFGGGSSGSGGFGGFGGGSSGGGGASGRW